MEYDEFLKWMQPLVDFRKEAEIRQELLSQLYPESTVIEDYGEDLFDRYTRLLSKMMNDDEDWISYFIWETEMGAIPMEIKINDEKKELRTLLDLYNIITEKEK